MDKTKYQMTIIEDGISHTEEYDAFIGIEIKDNHVLLHINEKGNLPDSFWRKLPDLMKLNIEQGMESRKQSLQKESNGH
jgi:hypothetical protein